MKFSVFLNRIFIDFYQISLNILCNFDIISYFISTNILSHFNKYFITF